MRRHFRIPRVCSEAVEANLYELGANEKVVQRILRHAKPHVTKERYIKAFDPAVLAAMKTLETTLDDFHKCSATVQQDKRFAPAGYPGNREAGTPPNLRLTAKRLI